MKYNTYLFDFDGTLVDSMPAYVFAVQKILDENNIEFGEDLVKAITPLGCAETAEYFKGLGVKGTAEEIVGQIGKYVYEEYLYNIQTKENVIPTLKKLKEMDADLNILTACPHILLDPCLKRLGLDALFSNVWSCDDFETSKTDVELYKTVAQKLEKPAEEILFLDDNYNANETAKRAGMKLCGVFDESAADYVDEIKVVADYYIYDMSELLEIVK